MKTLKTIINEAAGKSVTLSWDMVNPNKYAGDWQDQEIYLDGWNKRKGEITISGTDKALLNWLVGDYGLSKKDAQSEIKKGKRANM